MLPELVAYVLPGFSEVTPTLFLKSLTDRPSYATVSRRTNNLLFMRSLGATSDTTMRTHDKKKIYPAAMIAVTVEAIIALSLIFIPALTVFEKLKIFGGLFIIIKSVFLFFLLNDRLADEKLLRLSAMSFPIMTSFFAGLALFVSVWPSLEWLSNI